MTIGRAVQVLQLVCLRTRRNPVPVVCEGLFTGCRSRLVIVLQRYEITTLTSLRHVKFDVIRQYHDSSMHCSLFACSTYSVQLVGLCALDPFCFYREILCMHSADSVVGPVLLGKLRQENSYIRNHNIHRKMTQTQNRPQICADY